MQKTLLEDQTRRAFPYTNGARLLELMFVAWYMSIRQENGYKTDTRWPVTLKTK